jgi:hypothetical protein
MMEVDNALVEPSSPLEADMSMSVDGDEGEDLNAEKLDTASSIPLSGHENDNAQETDVKLSLPAKSPSPAPIQEPGILSIFESQEGPAILDWQFTVDDILAEKLGMIKSQGPSSTSAPDPINHNGHTALFTFWCIAKQALNGISKPWKYQDIAAVMHEVPVTWPSSGQLIVQVNSHQATGKTWHHFDQVRDLLV